MIPEIPSQREQMEAIQETESADAPSAFSVPLAEVDRALRQHGGKMRVFALYQQNFSRKDVIEAIKKEFGTGGRSIQLLDGTEAFMDYRPNTGLEFWRTPNDKKIYCQVARCREAYPADDYRGQLSLHGRDGEVSE